MRWNKSRYTFLICSNSRIFVHTIMHIILKQMEEIHYFHTFKTHKLLQSFGLAQNRRLHTQSYIHTYAHTKVTIYCKCGLGTLPPTYIFIPDIPFPFSLINCLCIFFLLCTKMIMYGVPIFHIYICNYFLIFLIQLNLVS